MVWLQMVLVAVFLHGSLVYDLNRIYNFLANIIAISCTELYVSYIRHKDFVVLFVRAS